MTADVIPIPTREKFQCTWISGNPRDLMCCGRPVINKLQYCQEHMAMAYRSPETTKKAKAKAVAGINTAWI